MNAFDKACQFFIDGNFTEAKSLFELLLVEQPDNLIVPYNLGLTCNALGLNDLAVQYTTIPAEQNIAESLISRGAMYRQMGRYQEALDDFGMSMIRNPTHAKSYCNYGNSLREFGMPALAVHFLRASQELDPTVPVAHMNEAIALLLNGSFEEGWKKYEHRWSYEHQATGKPKLPEPEWTGTESLRGKRILVYSEQGLGDAIQFVRYLPMLTSLGASVIFATHAPLISLFKRNFEFEVIGFDDSFGNIDYHCPLLSLPRAFNTTLETIPNPLAYLTSDYTIHAAWQNRLAPKLKPRIGIVWKTNVASGSSAFKCIALEQLASIVNDDFDFISLAIDVSDDDKAIMHTSNIKMYDEFVHDFDDTASLITNLDLVITIDTSVAHLAGALGTPTWVMLPKYGVDWRWLLERNDSPWYPNSTLIRQHEVNDWSNVIAQIKQMLYRFF